MQIFIIRIARRASISIEKIIPQILLLSVGHLHYVKWIEVFWNADNTDPFRETRIYTDFFFVPLWLKNPGIINFCAKPPLQNKKVAKKWRMLRNFFGITAQQVTEVFFASQFLRHINATKLALAFLPMYICSLICNINFIIFLQILSVLFMRKKLRKND